MTFTSHYKNCTLCPRRCGADRTVRPGFCGCTDQIRVARTMLHCWEEPCISGRNGSGAIFFGGCTLKCCFCQNYPISQEGRGTDISEDRLADICLELQEKGADTLSFITASQYIPSLARVLRRIRPLLHIPVVFNCSGYERVSSLKMLEGCVDVYLPDLKYFSSDISGRYSLAPDYFQHASKAIPEMLRQTGRPVVSEDGILTRGVLIRHLVLPGHREDSIRLLRWMADSLPEGSFLVSLMSQYTPFFHAERYPEINRRVTTYEYRKVVDAAVDLGLDQGFMQGRSSASSSYTPDFEQSGL